MKPSLRIIESPVVRILPHDPERRGYVVQYKGVQTPCPGCGRHQWHVGRSMAECGFCACALPIMEGGR